MFCCLWLAVSAAPLGADYDLVIANGRVMDPESGLDALRHIGVRDGRIAAVSDVPIDGGKRIDAQGLVVAPGFIDLHAHGQDAYSSSLKVQDGVTSAFDMEVGVYPVARWYASKQGKSVIHYGATVGHGAARLKLKHGIDVGHSPTASRQLRSRVSALNEWKYASLTPAELSELLTLLDAQLQAGGLGIGYGIQYTPGARREEIFRCFALAAEYGVANYVHARFMSELEPGSSVEALQEVIANAAAAKAAAHIFHIGSTGLSMAPLLLEMIVGARRNGVDISTEVYPYTAASTSLGSAMFDPGFRARMRIEYRDLVWTATGERLSADTFKRYRSEHPEGNLIIHIMKPEHVAQSIAHPLVMIASDGMVYRDGKAHPRSAGTYARVLGRYVREQETLGLMDALRKMTLMPAKRLQGAAPQMRRKGRINVGADADITVFDAARVRDRATFEEPTKTSAGIIHVLVAGTPVVVDGALLDGLSPGQPIRRERPAEIACSDLDPGADLGCNDGERL